MQNYAFIRGIDRLATVQYRRCFWRCIANRLGSLDQPSNVEQPIFCHSTAQMKYSDMLFNGALRRLDWLHVEVSVCGCNGKRNGSPWFHFLRSDSASPAIVRAIHCMALILHGHWGVLNRCIRPAIRGKKHMMTGHYLFCWIVCMTISESTGARIILSSWNKGDASEGFWLQM
jgi:hypothetical protein